MLVGHGEAGKTALMQRLIYDTFDDKVGLTDGIDVQAWEHAGVRFDMWDHPTFSSVRCIFLVVEWSSRTKQPRVTAALSQPDRQPTLPTHQCC
jgi:GTPase SAR1 family protein